MSFFNINRKKVTDSLVFRRVESLVLWNPLGMFFDSSKNKSLLSLGLFLMAIAVFFGIDSAKKCLYADSDTLPTQYCYVSHLNIFNNGSSEVAQGFFPVQVEFPYISWKQKGYIDKAHSSDYDTSKFWDIRGYNGSITNTFDIMASDIRNNQKGTYYMWIFPNSLESGSNDLSFFHGNQYQKRDQALYFFNDLSTAFATDHNDLDLSDEDWIIKTRIKVIPSSLETGDLLINKYDNDLQTGYKISIEKTTTGNINIVCHSDDIQLTAPFSIPSSSTFSQIHEIYFEKTANSKINCGLDENINTGTLTGNTTPTQEDLKIAYNMDHTHVFDLKIWDSSTPVVSYLFNPWEMSFNSQTGNNYSFTILNSLHNGNSHPVSYSLNTDQTKYTTQIVNPVSVFDQDSPQTASLINQNVADGLVPNNFFTSPTVDDENAFQTMLPTDSEYIPQNLIYAMIFVSTGLSLGALGFVFSRSIMFASFLSGIPITFAVSMEFLPMWYLFFYAILLVISFGAKEFGR